MSLYIASLNSGSNGNCYYVGNATEAVLIDAGISCREIVKRMKRLSLPVENLKAVFVSHEHADHIRGIPTIASKLNLPIHITADTLRFGRMRLDKKLVKPFIGYEPVQVGGITVTAFPKFHDASDPYSFIVACNETKVGVFTDIGEPCEHVINHFKQCHAAFLEANYDDDLLENGGYPYYLKKRIRGDKGHLSNAQALALFTTHRPAFMSHLVLSHLSKNNNHPEIVERLFNEHAGTTKIIVASRFEESAVYRIDCSQEKDNHTVMRLAGRFPQLQLSFDEEKG